jgi:hypothetical protein
MGPIDVSHITREPLIEPAKPGFAGVQPPAPEIDTRPGLARQVNADWNARPQSESSIAVHPTTGQWVASANDYGVGFINTGIYNSEGVNYFPPFPALLGYDGTTLFVIETPIFSNAAVAYGYTRAAADVPAGVPVAYDSTVAFSQSFCETGIFVSRSFDNGATWFRPLVKSEFEPLGRGNVVYFNQVNDCSVFHDKSYMVVDNTAGPHSGRVYVTWTQFLFTDTLQTNTINMAYSDDNGLTFSEPMIIVPHSDTLCPTVIPPDETFPTQIGTPGGCDIDQFSYPVVLADGTLAVILENGQSSTAPVDGLRGQMLLVKVNPDTLAFSGPFKVADLVDGLNDFPLNSINFRAVCNGDFFTGVSSANLAVDQAGTLYAVWFDDRNRAGQFPYPTYVGADSPHPCPDGKTTDAGVYVSKSTNGGVTWSAPQLVSSKPSIAGPHDQFSPWIVAGPSDHVDVVFYDRRYDPNNRLSDTTVARSTDGGRTFRQIKVSLFSSNYDNAATVFGNAPRIGDYLGMTMDGFGVSYPIWTGVKPNKGDSDIFMAIVGPDR